jgi:hypothetical protein
VSIAAGGTLLERDLFGVVAGGRDPEIRRRHGDDDLSGECMSAATRVVTLVTPRVPRHLRIAGTLGFVDVADLTDAEAARVVRAWKLSFDRVRRARQVRDMAPYADDSLGELMRVSVPAPTRFVQSDFGPLKPRKRA